MRAALSILGLVVALALVLFLMKKQAGQLLPPTAAPTAASAPRTAPEAVRQQVQEALDQAASRASVAQP